ncbi:MAG: cell wall metabolism sensor histidine kinase WalK [Pirellulales bacterium]|nr:cell wall metabolism sensor histidine kinase WalK [Pirellulales bacterium]
MNRTSAQLGFAASMLACAVSATALAAWLTGFVLPLDTPLARAVVAVAGAVFAGLSVAAFRYQLHESEQGLARYLDCLSQLDYRDAAQGDAERLAVPVSANHPLAAPLSRLSGAFAELGARLASVEHARSALDIRCRRQTAEAQRVREILSRLPEPVLVIDRYNDVQLANASAAELLGVDIETSQQRALARLVQCERLVELLCDTGRRKTATTRTDEIELADAEGTRRWFSVAASNLLVDEGDDAGSQGAVAVLRDISNQKAAQKRNAEFVSAASHEMKAPLAGIKAYVELLADGDVEDQETREEFLTVINGQADRLQRLIDNLLNLARIEAGVVQVKKQQRSLNELLQEAFDVVQPAAERKQIELVADLSPLYLGVLADRDMLLQAAINLLSNAIKYTPEQGRVTLRSRMADKEVLFEVEDTGVGLSEEDCRKVFEKFYRVEKDTKMAPGTGLGLPLAKHIVEDVHQGSLSVTSKLGAGSTFRVTLPAAGQMN